MDNSSHDHLETASHTINLLLLTWAAGVLDGLSYIRAHVFTANMTGNLVLLGIHFAQRQIGDAARSLLSLIAFAFGCILAASVLARQEQWGRSILARGFATELCFLLIFAAAFNMESANDGALLQGAVICSAAIALGVQSVTVRRLRISGVVTTFITGTITTSMVGAVGLFSRKRGRAGQHNEEEHVALLIGILFVYFAAVVFAACLSSRAPLLIATIPAALLALVLLRLRLKFPEQ